jgi:hypothetical protein
MRCLARGAALTAAITALASLTGCDYLLGKMLGQSDEVKVIVTIAFAPGYRMSAGGADFPVYGLDICPEPEAGKVFVMKGPFGNADPGRYGCIVVKTGMTHVKVVRRKHDEQVTEVWGVVQDGVGVHLWTPAGDPAVAATRQ